MPELKLGYQGPLYGPWYDWAFEYAKSYNFLLGKKDFYFGGGEEAYVREMQRRLGIVIDGKFGDRTAAAVGYKWPNASSPPVVEQRRPIWFYSCPGSGADYWMGPSHDVGEMVCGRAFNERHRQSLRINHQPVSFQKGGYLGFMGGNPKFSYLEVIADQKASLRYLIANNQDKDRPDFEMWFSGYSQSADGLCDAILDLFGDNGEFKHLRPRINGLLCFGNPATPITGIARKVYPDWLNRLIVNINTRDDFYAVAPDRIRPAFYSEIIKAEMELPFFVHLLRISLPVIEEWASILMPPIAPLLKLGSPLLQMGLGLAAGGGIGTNPDMGRIIGMAGSRQDLATTKTAADFLRPSGLMDVQNITELFGVITALPGLASHGAYHAIMPPRPEFDNRTGTQLAYDVVANFKR